MRIMLSLAATAAVALMATAANATTFIGTFDVTPNTDPGLVIKTNPDNGPINGAGGFSINSVGGSYTINNLFTIYTDEDSIQSDDTHPDPIKVAFNFSSPTASGNVGGTVAAVDGAFWAYNYGEVNWNGPTIVNFGNGGQLQITLSDEKFNSQFDTSIFSDPLNDGKAHGANVSATFKLLKDSAPGGVPEPATWAMMIGGFGMTGAMLRRRRTAMVAA